jgi:hypothetical protein
LEEIKARGTLSAYPFILLKEPPSQRGSCAPGGRNDPVSGLFAALKRVKGRRKPTSVALEAKSIEDLKKIAKKLDVPYQALMRLFILDGINHFKKSTEDRSRAFAYSHGIRSCSRRTFAPQRCRRSPS